MPVHLFNGVFGTLCVGLFAVDKITGAATGNGLFYGGGMTLLIAQLKGIGAVAVYTLVVSLVFWFAIKATIGLRVSKEEEEEGLDIGEHGQVAYIIPSTRIPKLERSRRKSAVTAHPQHLSQAPTGSSRSLGAACAGHHGARYGRSRLSPAADIPSRSTSAVVMLSGRRFVLALRARRRGCCLRPDA